MQPAALIPQQGKATITIPPTVWPVLVDSGWQCMRFPRLSRLSETVGSPIVSLLDSLLPLLLLLLL